MAALLTATTACGPAADAPTGTTGSRTPPTVTASPDPAATTRPAIPTTTAATTGTPPMPTSSPADPPTEEPTAAATPTGPPPDASGTALLGTGATWSAPSDRWVEGDTRGPFTLFFAGYGEAQATPAGVTLAPQAAQTAARTHGALVTTTQGYDRVTIGARLTTTAQLRTPTPNPWEVGWLLWAVQDADHFYAVVLKPNGWELSKQDPAYPGGQRFLASGRAPSFAVGVPHELVVQHARGTSSVWADGLPLVTFTDTERPYAEGHVGLYCEDARVTVDRLDIATG